MAHGKCPQCGQVAYFQVHEQEKDRRRANYKEDEDGYLRIDLCLVCGWGGIDRSVEHGGYFNRDLVRIKEEWPRWGRRCPHCDRRIPRFLELTPETASRARGLIKEGRKEVAVQAIQEATGCPRAWAHLWSEHPDGPISAPE